jgi:uncharacterized RDD family membrane protein YckC
MLDTIKTVETPEGVTLQLTCVSFYARSIAWFIDALIHAVFLIFFLFLLPQLGDFGMGLFLIVLFLLTWFYPVLFEVYMQGQTPGKRVMGIQVLLNDGSMVNWNASLLRNLLRTVDFLPFLYALGIASMLMSKNFRRLGDLAANTIVVYKRRLSDKKEIAFVEPEAPNFALSAKEQQIIVNYAERMYEFSDERAEELALLAEPLVKNTRLSKQNFPASHKLLAIANYLVGRR